MTKILILTVFLLFGASVASDAYAQRRIYGTVSDSHNNPLCGSTVTVKELPAVGAVADNKGYYELLLPKDNKYTIIVTHIGYDRIKKSIGSDRYGVLNFKLTESNTMLNQIVVTGTRTPKLLKDAPIITRVILESDIRRADASNIADLLKTELPGIEFSYSMNQQISLNMCGFGGNSILFLADGERIAGETLNNVDYNRLNLDNVSRIEIVKGAASSLYGSNAIGGVVNIISRECCEPWSVNLNGRYGAHNERRYGGSVGFCKGRFNSISNLQYTSIGTIDLSRGAEEENIGDYRKIFGHTTLNIKERLIFTASNNIKITARAGYFFKERATSDNPKSRYRGFTGGLKGSCDISHKDNLELLYSFDQYDKSDYMTDKHRELRKYSNVQHIVHALYNHIFAGKHTLTAGGDYMRDYLMSYQFSDGGSNMQHTADAFVQYDWNPLKELNINAGVRYDYFSKAGLSHIAPKIGLLYKTGGFCSLRGSYSGGFRAPTLKEMYMNFFMGNIFMIYGNPNLKPESSHNFSVSAEYMEGRHCLAVTGFYNIVRNRITTVWDQSLGGQVYTNIPQRLHVAGIDANASGKYPCGVSWRLSYTYTYEHHKKGEATLSSTRPHSATAHLTYNKDWSNYGVGITLSGNYMSKVTTSVFSKAVSHKKTKEQNCPGYTIWKLNISQHLQHGINLSLTIDNIFNYRPSYYYSNSPSTTGTACYIGLSLDIQQMFTKR